jgi:hypothetical protein
MKSDGKKGSGPNTKSVQPLQHPKPHLSGAKKGTPGAPDVKPRKRPGANGWK